MNREVHQLRTTAAKLENDYLEDSQLSQIAINERDLEISVLQEELQELTRQSLERDRSLDFSAAASLYASGDILGAADLLAAASFDGMPQDILNMTNALKEEVYPLAARQYFEEAVAHFLQAEYTEAGAKFEKCNLLSGSEADYADSLWYYMGLLAVEEGDNDTARIFFRRILDFHTDSQWFSQAENQINLLTEE